MCISRSDTYIYTLPHIFIYMYIHVYMYHFWGILVLWCSVVSSSAPLCPGHGQGMEDGYRMEHAWWTCIMHDASYMSMEHHAQCMHNIWCIVYDAWCITHDASSMVQHRTCILHRHYSAWIRHFFSLFKGIPLDLGLFSIFKGHNP